VAMNPPNTRIDPTDEGSSSSEQSSPEKPSTQVHDPSPVAPSLHSPSFSQLQATHKNQKVLFGQPKSNCEVAISNSSPILVS